MTRAPIPAPVVASRRVIHWAIRAVALSAVLASLVIAATTGGDAGVLTLPVLVEAVLVVVALEVARASREELRVDALTLFTAWETMRGCVTPVIIQYLGNGHAFYYRLGTYADTELVLWLAVLFFVVVIATRLSASIVGSAARGSDQVALRVSGLGASRISSWVLIGLGAVGLVIRFPSPGAVAGFLSGAIEQLQGTGEGASSGIPLIGMVLRPMLFVGLVLLARDRRRAGRSVLPVVPFLVVAVVFGLASYGLNRATVAYAIIGMVFVFAERAAGALRGRHLAGLLGLLTAFFVLVGTLRSSLWVTRTGLDAPTLQLVPVLQSVIPYFGTPMQLAAAIPPVRVSDPFGMTSFVLSVLSPIPGAPDAARTASSTALYNNIVYHSFVGKDQLLPTWFEGFLCFGVIGVIGSGVVVGLLLAVSDLWRRRTSTVLGSYAAALFVLWIAQASVTSFNVIEQNLIYFIVPPFVLSAGAALWPGRRSERQFA
ncbi:hypothetical protein ACLBWP_09245 [Microbacterium sp. M1A1_1b]